MSHGGMRCGIREESQVKKRRKIRQSEQPEDRTMTAWCMVRAQVWEMRGTRRMIDLSKEREGL
jgi:hypothetical protein